MKEILLLALGFVDDHDWVITFIVGLFAFFLYVRSRSDARRDAAKLILQEMRYADQKVRNYRSYESYSFNEKILPTNSWHKNISLFIRKLTESEIDLISKFFSTAAYLDEVIKAISDEHNKNLITSNTPPVEVDGGETPIAIGTGTLLKSSSKRLIETISRDIESVYNTPAADKLRKIAEKKWYEWI